jgi:excisionase family DNA binding protein
MTPEPLLTARQVAELLGFSAATVVDWAEADKIPSFKVGGRLRFRLSEVEAWLEEGRRGRERHGPRRVDAVRLSDA